jgi:hypothetical protein
MGQSEPIRDTGGAPDDAPLPLNSLWIGPALAPLHQLCLLSAVAAGHRVRLFHYGRLDNVPDSIEQADARDIFPESAIIRHRRTGSPSIFADRFRYEIMRRGLGAWTDTDVLFLKPLMREAGMICGWESTSLVGNSVLYFNPDCAVLEELHRRAMDDYPVPAWYFPAHRAWLALRKRLGRPVPVTALPWGVLGPGLLTYILRRQKKLDRAWPVHRLYPIPYKEKFGPFQSRYDFTRRIRPDTVGIHLWAQGLHGGIAASRSSPLPLAEPDSLVARRAREIGFPL